MSYLIFILPALLFSIYAQFKVKSAYKKASAIAPLSGLTGAEAAQRILNSSQIGNVKIETIGGVMGDHYDPKNKVLRLSNDVYYGRSLAALGIAAHEAGHALQDAKGYTPLILRNGIVPLASIGSNMSFGLIFVGMLLSSMNLMMLGVLAFSLVVVFQLVNLPVEFNASARAKNILYQTGMITAGEQGAVSGVLSAAALTYVAATASAITTLLYYLVQMGLLGGRDE